MIIFNNSSTSPWMTALTLIIIFLCLIISTFLNPTVFLYNKKKTSIAGLLFCIISATDFTICNYWTIITLYYAATINLKTMSCQPTIEPQRCQSEATQADMAITIFGLILSVTSLVTTGILSIVRAIQIRFPFYRVRKSRVLILTALFIVTQAALWGFNVVTPMGDKKFFAVNLAVSSIDAYGLANETELLKEIFIYLPHCPVLIIQASAVFASALTAFTLFQEKNCEAQASNARKRSLGALKVLLTNIPNMIIVLIFSTPIVSLIHKSFIHDDPTEKDGWMIYLASNFFFILTSVWNPIVFISLTPKSRERLKALPASITRSFGFHGQV